jgi:dihydroorotate dehydrogenase (NAD+) catalytic subunit
MMTLDLFIDPPLMNAAGSLGFSPDLHGPLDWTRFGAFITNPISLMPRTPAHGLRFAPFPGGFLLHTGFPNPGLTQALRRYAGHWRGSPLPVIVHLLARNPGEVATMVRRLESVEGVSGLELGVTSEMSAEMVVTFTQSASGELPVIMHLPLERSVELAPHAMNAGAAAISLAPLRGVYPMAGGEMIAGRLYGPAFVHVALRMVQELARMSIPVIGAGGVTTQEHKDAMLSAGALGVQLDSILWCRAGYCPII